MSEAEFNKIFARNLSFYLQKNEMLQVDLARKMGISESTVSRWLDAQKAPRMNTVDEICKILGITRTDLIVDHDSETYKNYYINSKTQEIAQEIYDDKDLSLLFDAAKDASPEDLQTVYTMLKALKDKETNRYD